MFGCTLAFAYAVRAIGIGHILKQFSVFDQLVYQQLGILKMHIVVACAMDVQQISLEIFGVGDG